MSSRPAGHHRPGRGRRRRRPAAAARPPAGPLGRRRPAARVPGHRGPPRAPGPRRAAGAPGRRERPAGRGRHPLAHLLDDQAGHLGRGDDAVRGGRLRAGRPDREVAARVRRAPRLRRGIGPQAGDRAGRPSRSACGTCSPTRRGSPTASTTPTPSTACTAPRATSGHPARPRLGRLLPAVGVDAAGVPARHRVELRRLHRRARPARRGDLRPAARRVLRAAHLRARSAWPTPRSACATATTPSRWPSSTSPSPGQPGGPPPG